MQRRKQETQRAPCPRQLCSARATHWTRKALLFWRAHQGSQTGSRLPLARDSSHLSRQQVKVPLKMRHPSPLTRGQEDRMRCPRVAGDLLDGVQMPASPHPGCPHPLPCCPPVTAGLGIRCSCSAYLEAFGRGGRKRRDHRILRLTLLCVLQPL